MRVITVDGGHGVASDTAAAQSVGVLYPGERMDVVVDGEAGAGSSELVVTLDKE